jgi:thiosulfate/3-mercaptopyruvate sulfurtransferase
MAALISAPAPAVVKETPLLVGTSWVAERLGESHFVVLHVGDRAGYDREHIPGARNVLDQQLAKPHDMSRDELMMELPEPRQLRSQLEQLGISDDSIIVVYAAPDAPLQAATRVMFTLDYIGLGAQSALLDGGLDAWRAAGRPVSTNATIITAGTLRERPLSAVVADAVMVQSMSRRADGKIVDARAPVFYSGAEPTFGKSGHIPGAISIPFSSVSDTAGRISGSDLKRLFAVAGVRPGDTVIAYCHVGQQGTAVVFAARLLGFRALLYDGSFQDWATNNRGPVE